MKKQYFILFLFFILISQYTYSQNTGYLGKKFVLKTDLFNGTQGVLGDFQSRILCIFPGISLEYIPSKTITFSLKGTYFNKKVKQEYNKSDYPEENTIFLFPSPKTMPEKAKISVTGVTVEARQYVTFNEGLNRILRAPQGFFFYESFFIGKLNIKKGYIIKA
jgi:hypothetical protein